MNQKPPAFDWRKVALLLFVIGLTVTIFIFRDQVNKLSGLGYPGIFLVSLFSNASLILPVPGVMFTSAMGAVFNPFWVAIAAGSGAAVGEMSGYMAGYSGSGVVERRKFYEWVEPWMRKYGPATVFVLAFIPNPLFDMAGIIAGGLKMPLVTFFVCCWLGKVLKMMLFSYGGAHILSWFPS